jgi:hypothetical protein
MKKLITIMSLLCFCFTIQGFAADLNSPIEKYMSCGSDIVCRKSNGDGLVRLLEGNILDSRSNLKAATGEYRSRLVSPIYASIQENEDDLIEDAKSDLDWCTFLMTREGCYIERQATLLDLMTKILNESNRRVELEKEKSI